MISDVEEGNQQKQFQETAVGDIFHDDSTSVELEKIRVQLSNLSAELVNVKIELSTVKTELDALKGDGNLRRRSEEEQDKNRVSAGTVEEFDSPYNWRRSSRRYEDGKEDTTGVTFEDHPQHIPNDVSHESIVDLSSGLTMHRPKQDSGRTLTRGFSSTRRSLTSSRKSTVVAARGWGYDTAEASDGDLEHDLFTMMMMASPISEPINVKIPFRCPCPLYGVSKPWILGMISFVVQFSLGGLIMVEQTINIHQYLGCAYLLNNASTNGYRELCFSRIDIVNSSNYFDIPIRLDALVAIAQAITIPLAAISQTELVTSLRTIHQLRYTYNKNWHQTIGVGETEKTTLKWFVRVLFPNLLKFLEAFIILFASWIVIVQSNSIVDLLKDFSALLVVSTIDDLLFLMARNGLFGKDLIEYAEETMDAKIHSDTRKTGMGKITAWFKLILLVTMLGGWAYLVNGQLNGRYFRAAYPHCGEAIDNFFSDLPPSGRRFVEDIKLSYHALYDDDICEGFMNNAACGYDGGDCETFSKDYPGCYALSNLFLGDGVCGGGTFNTEECDFDAGDCDAFNSLYPDCDAPLPFNIGNGICESHETELYNTTECGYDGGDCL